MSNGNLATERAPEREGPGLLEGVRLLVTGGSRGIGQGICAIAAQEGASVAFTWSSHEAGARETEAPMVATRCISPDLNISGFSR